MKRTFLLLALAALAACVPKKVHEEPIMENDQRVGDSSTAVADGDGAGRRREGRRPRSARRSRRKRWPTARQRSARRWCVARLPLA